MLGDANCTWARVDTNDTAYLVAIFFLMKTFTSRALTLTKFCPSLSQ